MTIFDTDVLVEILVGNPRYVDRAAAISPNQQGIAIITAEEIPRGRLHSIRQAEAGKGRIAIAQAYDFFSRSLHDLQQLAILPYTPSSDLLFQQWRKQKVHVSTHDLRIAAICVEHSATLASRNRRDFERIPGLPVEFWE